MNDEKIKKICEFCLELNNDEALNMDDIDLIYKELKEFNGENDKRMITKMSDWKLGYRKDGYDGKGWYWHLDLIGGTWDYGSYSDKECAIDDFKLMAENRGFKVEE